MNCSEAAEAIENLVDSYPAGDGQRPNGQTGNGQTGIGQTGNGLSGTDRASLERHAAACKTCADTLRDALAITGVVTRYQFLDVRNGFASRTAERVMEMSKIKQIGIAGEKSNGALGASGPAGWKVWASVAAAACFVLVVIFFGRQGGAPAVSRIGTSDKAAIQVCRIVSMEGNPILTRGDGTLETPSVDTGMGVDDSIETGIASTLKLEYPDLTSLQVVENTTLVVKRDSIMLNRGGAWLKVTKRGSTFTVSTPTAIMGVLGTRFLTTVSGAGETGVRVEEGRVWMTPRKAGSGDPDESRRTILEPGDEVRVDSRGGITDSSKEGKVQKEDEGGEPVDDDAPAWSEEGSK